MITAAIMSSIRVKGEGREARGVRRNDGSEPLAALLTVRTQWRTLQFITTHASHLTPHPSLLTPRASRLTPHGFTYIGLLIFIALIGVALAGTGMVWHTETIRAKEAELLFIGHQYRGAIGRYHESIPGSAKKYPRSIEDLLKDNRYPGVKRYLRKIYRDPMTGNTEWGIVTSADGGVMGVYSLSDQDVLKTGNFSMADQDFEGKMRYSEWKFTYAPLEAPAAGTTPAASPPVNSPPSQ